MDTFKGWFKVETILARESEELDVPGIVFPNDGWTDHIRVYIPTIHALHDTGTHIVLTKLH